MTDGDQDKLIRYVKWATIGAGIGLLLFVLFGASWRLAPISGFIIGWLTEWLAHDDEANDV